MSEGAVWLDHPYHVDATGRTAVVAEDGRIRDMIEQILFTSPGERVMRPDFGCGLKQLVFMPASDALAASTQQLVQGSLMRWLEGVIAVEAVTCEIGDGSIEVTVVWRKLDTGERQEGRFVREVVP
ncbi:MAG: GPW/gp25 family protein [Geminicoccaceae bacterium]